MGVGCWLIQPRFNTRSVIIDTHHSSPNKPNNMELKRVVVTGMGAVTPVGNTPQETWENLLAGKSGAAPITLFDASKFKTQFACEVKNLNVNDFIDRKEARKMDRYTQLAIIAAMQAVKDCGMDLETED